MKTLLNPEAERCANQIAAVIHDKTSRQKTSFPVLVRREAKSPARVKVKRGARRGTSFTNPYEHALF